MPCHNTNYPEIQTLPEFDHSCEECNLKCLKVRNCPHECKIGKCHIGECPECDIIYSLKCYCGKNDIKLKCKEYVKYVKENNDFICCCDNICMKKLPCGHYCKDKCHKGQCNGILNCNEEVLISCKCGKLIEKSKCCDARKEAIPLGIKMNKDNMYVLLKCEDHILKEEKKNDEIVKEKSNKNMLLIISIAVVVIAVVIIYYTK